MSWGGNQSRTIGKEVRLAICLVGQNKGSREYNFLNEKNLIPETDLSFAKGPENATISH